MTETDLGQRNETDGAQSDLCSDMGAVDGQ